MDGWKDVRADSFVCWTDRPATGDPITPPRTPTPRHHTPRHIYTRRTLRASTRRRSTPRPSSAASSPRCAPRSVRGTDRLVGNHGTSSMRGGALTRTALYNKSHTDLDLQPTQAWTPWRRTRASGRRCWGSATSTTSSPCRWVRSCVPRLLASFLPFLYTCCVVVARVVGGPHRTQSLDRSIFTPSMARPPHPNR